ncbi:hypothetical protein GCM10027570_37370 [Streptomonospora sediminis]
MIAEIHRNIELVDDDKVRFGSAGGRGHEEARSRDHAELKPTHYSSSFFSTAGPCWAMLTGSSGVGLRGRVGR